MKKTTYLITTTSLIFYFMSLLIFKLDTNFAHIWLTLCLSMFPLLLVVILWILSLIPHKKILSYISPYSFTIILIIALISSLIYLTDYPFISVGDELRDGGLNAQEITTGQIKNIFEYGRYGAHGLIIPTITSVFYKIFGSSVLVYRLPAAIVSVLDIVLLFFLLSFLTKNKMASFLGTMALVALPLHLFYSRTEIVIILNSCFSTIILLSLFVFFRRKATNIIDYIFLGTLLGFTFNLHAGIKASAIIVFIIIVFINFYQWFSRKTKLSQLIVRLFLLTLFLFVGFGPRLLNTSSMNMFLHTSRLPYVTEGQVQMKLEDVKNIGEKYQKSLLVWISEPTNAWYPDHNPIFSPVIFLLMILGIIAGIAKKHWYLFTVLFIALSLHLTNSALTDILNGDHRLSPLYPIGVLFVGVGIAFLINKIKMRPLQYIFALSLFIFLSYQTVLFFTHQPVNKNKDVGDYLSMHTINFLRTSNPFNETDNLTFFVSPFNYQKLNYLHYKEQYAFFLPTLSIEIEKGDAIGNNEIYIKNNNFSFGKSVIIKCSGKDYYCPIKYKSDILIHY